MEVVPAQTKHIALIQSTFSHRRSQRKENHTDYLALPDIADFHCQRLCQQIEQSKTSPFNLYIKNNRLIAIAAYELSKWHSDHFSVPYYKIQPFYCFTNEPQSLKSFVQNWKQTLRTDQMGIYTLRVEAHEAHLSYALQGVGARHVGGSLRMILPQEKINVDTISTGQYDFEQIKEFQEADLAAIKQIGAENHSHSHFFNDSRLDPALVHTIFAKWLEKCAGGVANKIFIAEHLDKPVGFASLLTSEALVKTLGKRIGMIDFIVADHSVQGMGIGAALLQASLNWFKEQVDWIELRTMWDNLQAIRFYQKHGFRLLSSDHHFHLWSDDLKQ